MNKLIACLFCLVFITACKNEQDGEQVARDTSNQAAFIFKNGVLVDSANARIRRFQSANGSNRLVGVFYTKRELEEYLTKFADIESQQPSLGENQEYAVGHLFTIDADGKPGFVVAPVILSKKDNPSGAPTISVTDPYTDPSRFRTNLQTSSGAPHFYYNEGQKWP